MKVRQIDDFVDFLYDWQNKLYNLYYREYVYLTDGLEEYVYEFIAEIFPKLFDTNKSVEELADYPFYICPAIWMDYVDLLVKGDDSHFEFGHHMFLKNPNPMIMNVMMTQNNF